MKTHLRMFRGEHRVLLEEAVASGAVLVQGSKHLKVMKEGQLVAVLNADRQGPDRVPGGAAAELRSKLRRHDLLVTKERTVAGLNRGKQARRLSDDYIRRADSIRAGLMQAKAGGSSYSEIAREAIRIASEAGAEKVPTETALMQAVRIFLLDADYFPTRANLDVMEYGIPVGQFSAVDEPDPSPADIARSLSNGHVNGTGERDALERTDDLPAQLPLLLRVALAIDPRADGAEEVLRELQTRLTD